MSREYTTDEIRDMFIQRVNDLIDYWATLPDEENGTALEDKKWRVQGMTHSIFAILDGCTLPLPGFIVAPMPHEGDQSYHEMLGENYFPYNDQQAVRADIGGNLRYWCHPDIPKNG
jgi:hypothetical protein